MKKLLLLKVFLAFSLSGFPQGGYIAPGPDALGLARFANTPVNYYTGTPQINIPLTQISGKEISVPVSLSYNASGIRVQDIAGSVGLGWSLNAGGVITRVVRGLPDDLTDGFCTSNAKDVDPDLYFYNFLGQSGKFVLDRYGNALTIPYRDIIIRPGICKNGSNGVWEIIDESGTSYKFGSGYSSIEKTTVKPNDASQSQYDYNSSWMLSEVVSANGTDRLTFAYSSSSFSYPTFSYSQYQGSCVPNTDLKDNGAKISVTQPLVYKITSTLQSVYFDWKYDRSDLTGAAYLYSVRAYNAVGQLLGKNTLAYSYFQSDGCTTQLCKRLRLDKIFDLAPDPIYSFTYNTSVNLPSIDSNSFDDWGYYNNNPSTSWIFAQRSPDPSRTVANLISRIESRNGSYQDFEFEAHQNESNQTVGGARVKRISTFDGARTTSKNFTYNLENGYSSGIQFRKPQYYIYSQFGGGNILYYSHSFVDLFDVNGGHIGYSKVQESIDGGYLNTYSFSNYNSYPDIAQDCGDPAWSMYSYKGWKRGNLENLLIQKDGKTLKQVTNEFNYDAPEKNSITVTKILSFQLNCGSIGGGVSCWPKYTEVSQPFMLTKTTQEIYDPANSSKKATTITEYNYDPNNYQLIKTTKYDATQPSKKYISTVKYSTHSDYQYSNASICGDQYTDCLNACSQVTDFGDCGCYNSYNACLNYSPTTNELQAINQLVARHQLVPIETTSQYQDASGTKLLSASVNLFTITGGSGTQVQLKETWGANQLMDLVSFNSSHANSDGSFSFDSHLRKLSSYNSYDQTTGNLLQQTAFNGIQTNYMWDSYSQPIQSTVTGGVNTRTVSTTFKQLVGKTSTTDANGRKAYYDYDVYNRPFTTKDHQGNILTRTRYHYKNETPGFMINASATEGVANQSSFYFYVTDVAASIGGTPQFVWDFGDGTVLDNNSTSVYHTYTNPGTYTAKLTGLNPEYGPTTRTSLITVNAALSASICEDGPINIDLCGISETLYGGCTTNKDPHSSLKLTANPLNGCPSSYSYNWQVYYQGSYIQGLGAQQTTYYDTSSVGRYEIRCTITDGCGGSIQTSSYVTVYKSKSDCRWD